METYIVGDNNSHQSLSIETWQAIHSIEKRKEVRLSSYDELDYAAWPDDTVYVQIVLDVDQINALIVALEDARAFLAEE